MTIEELDRQVQALADWYIREVKGANLVLKQKGEALVAQADAAGLSPRLVAAVLQGLMLRIVQAQKELEANSGQ